MSEFHYIINFWPNIKTIENMSAYELAIFDELMEKYRNPIPFIDISEIYDQFDDVDPKNIRVCVHGKTLRLKKHKYLYDLASKDILAAYDYHFPDNIPRTVLPHHKIERKIINPHIITHFAQQL